jgi:hypothetical protein
VPVIETPEHIAAAELATRVALFYDAKLDLAAR